MNSAELEGEPQNLACTLARFWAPCFLVAFRDTRELSKQLRTISAFDIVMNFGKLYLKSFAPCWGVDWVYPFQQFGENYNA